ncbi:unnamed protein product [Closterium sp. NIES-53]
MSVGAEPRGTPSAGGPAGASPHLSPRREPLSPQQLHEWFAQRTRLRSGVARAGGSPTRGTAAGGAGATSPRGARTRGTGAAGAGGVGDPGAGGAVAGGTGASSPGGAGVTTGARCTGGARTRGNKAAGAGSVGGTRAGGADAGGAGAGDTGAGGAGAGDPGAGGAGAGGARAGGTGAGGAGAGGCGARDPGARGAGAGGTGAGGTVPRRLLFVPPLPSSLPPPDSVLRQVLITTRFPLPTPSPYAEQIDSFTERREPESRPASPVRTGRRVPHPHPPLVPGTHIMALRPSSVPLQVPLPPPPTSSLADGLNPESDLARAASPTVPRLLATVVTDPLFESTAASALVAELVDFAATCCLEYATSLVAESESDCPPFVGGECALGTDILEDRQEHFECLAASVPHLMAMLLAPEGDPDAPDIPTPRSYAEAITGPYSSQWQTAMDAEMASWKPTGTYVNVVPPSRVNIVNGMWIFRVKRPPGSRPVFKTRYVARGFSQRQGVDFFQTFSPTPKMTTLRGSLHEEIWLRHPPRFTESFPAGTQWSLQRPVYGLRQASRECHDKLRTTLAALRFAPLIADPSLFLRTDTSLPPFYVLVYIDDLIFTTANIETLTLVKLELQKRHTCTDLGPSALRLLILLATVHSSAYQSFALSSTFERVRRAEWPVSIACGLPHVDNLATQRSTQGYTFSLGSGSISWRSTCSSSVLSSSCEAEIYAGGMAAQKLRWLTYLLTDLGERPRSTLVLDHCLPSHAEWYVFLLAALLLYLVRWIAPTELVPHLLAAAASAAADVAVTAAIAAAESPSRSAAG